ncbi:hypothetical protein NC652_005069 [Populus alba x Populus x berolinensis]|uniref:HSP20-like chaperones superfamily protein n=1 Tax=Populus tomentosa TaxID=118781 RepID=A0A8X8DD31_POPTO|nr:hypothetical protein POTOM_007100 [Populus tomentosa]KAJ6953256.1 hypothetical protein NC652_005069 [Populus alba x Populus x berolinensis]
MDVKEKNVPLTGFVNAPSDDQHFLLNFIMSTFLGPDLYSDNPRCSAAHRLAKGLPPYTSNNLGDSFLRISQLESLYYYVLRNAHPSLVLSPITLCLYLKGKLHLSGSEPLEDCRLFTSFFPLSIHGHKKDSASLEIVKGIVLIENPDTSYMKEDLEKFKWLSGVDSLKIDTKKCLSYEHESQKGGEETEQFRIPKSDEKTAGTISSRNEKPPAMFQHKYKRRRRCSLSVSEFHCGVSHPQGHSEESNSFGRSCKLDGPTTMPRVAFPKFKDYFTDKSVILTGTARRELTGPPIGIVDIGISKAAYFFQVALPGVRSDSCEFSCEIESDGKVHMQGSTSGGKIIKKRSRVFRMKSQQMCPPGPFTVSFNLPGPVDPRLVSPKFRTDGIFEAVVIKQK